MYINGYFFDFVVVRNSELLGFVVNIEIIDFVLFDYLVVKFKILIMK